MSVSSEFKFLPLLLTLFIAYFLNQTVSQNVTILPSLHGSPAHWSKTPYKRKIFVFHLQPKAIRSITGKKIKEKFSAFHVDYASSVS